MKNVRFVLIVTPMATAVVCLESVAMTDSVRAALLAVIGIGMILLSMSTRRPRTTKPLDGCSESSRKIVQISMDPDYSGAWVLADDGTVWRLNSNPRHWVRMDWPPLPRPEAPEVTRCNP